MPPKARKSLTLFLHVSYMCPTYVRQSPNLKNRTFLISVKQRHFQQKKSRSDEKVCILEKKAVTLTPNLFFSSLEECFL